MKRAGTLMEQIAAPENLRLAFWKASKGKWSRPATLRFARNLEANITQMSAMLLEGRFVFGNYRSFKIFDPKERLIHAAAFNERVAHHGILNLCEPVFEKAAIFDSYACRKGKGRLAALERAQKFTQRHRFFLKMDVRRYFDSVSHERLLALLVRKFKDPAVLALFEQIVRGYCVSPGLGLPIGSLTSQYFANFYLGALDRMAMESEASPAYIRYMDDFIVWSNDRAWLKGLRGRIENFLAEKLGLRLKEFPLLNCSSRGVGFLGARVFPGTLRLNHRSKIRFLRKLRMLERQYEAGVIGAVALQMRATSLLATVRQVDSLGFRRSAGIWQDVDGNQTARTVSCAGATGTTTRTTRGARTATTTPRRTRTTTTASAWPERAQPRRNPLPEDAPVSAPPNALGALAKSKGPPGAGRMDQSSSNAPVGAVPPSLSKIIQGWHLPS
jgi:RNA-directed DNA polymerase